MLTSKWVCLAVFLVSSCGELEAALWKTQVIASIDALYGHQPRISDGRIVWADYDGHDLEVFLYENGTVKQLTDNQVEDRQPRIAGGNIAWTQLVDEGGVGTGDDAYHILVNGKTVAESFGIEPGVRVGREIVAWDEPPSSAKPSRIHYYNGDAIVSVAAEGTRFNHNVDIYATRVVWSGFDDSGNHAYFYDGVKVTQLPDGVGLGQLPQINGDYVTGIFVDSDGFTNGVTRYDISSEELSSYPQGRGFVSVPFISEQFIAWSAGAGTQRQLFVLKDEQPFLLDEGEEVGPFRVRDNFVAWSKSGDQGGIFLYDGLGVTRIADGTSDKWLSDGEDDTLVWVETDDLGRHIVVANLVVPEPATISIFAATLVSLLTCPRSRA